MKKLPFLLKFLIILVAFYILHFTFYISLAPSVFAADNLVATQNGHFYLNNQPFKFIGVNVNSLIRTDVTPEERERRIRFMANQCGVTVIRLFYPESDYGDLNSLKNALELGAKYGIRFIVTLGDSVPYNSTWFYYKDLDLYKKNALETIKALKIKYGNAVLAWELLNKPHCNRSNVPSPVSCRKSFYSFMKDFSQVIKRNDSYHLISPGLESMIEDNRRDVWSSLDSGSGGSDFLAINRLPDINICENHSYIEFSDNPDVKINEYIPPRIVQARSVNKPFFVEEFNDINPDRRKASISKAIDVTFNNGGEGFLVYPLEGDNIFDTSRDNKSDFCQILKEKANSYASKTSPYPLAIAAGVLPVKIAGNVIIINTITAPGIGWTNLASVISSLVYVLLIISALATFLYLIMGGLMWITSGGDAKKTEAAGKQITNALVGLGIVAAAWALMIVIQKFFNITILGNQINIPQPE